jgi:hypothetical protein
MKKGTDNFIDWPLDEFFESVNMMEYSIWGEKMQLSHAQKRALKEVGYFYLYVNNELTRIYKGDLLFKNHEK